MELLWDDLLATPEDIALRPLGTARFWRTKEQRQIEKAKRKFYPLDGNPLKGIEEGRSQ